MPAILFAFLTVSFLCCSNFRSSSIKTPSFGYTMIFILVYAESFKSIGMLAYRMSFCCCRSKVCSDAFRKFVFTEFLTTWVRVEIVMCDSRLVINSIF